MPPNPLYSTLPVRLLFSHSFPEMHFDDSLVQYKRREPATEEDEKPIDFKKAAECSLPPIDPQKALQNVMDAILPPR